jgi:peptide/nickel transport system substrate-binding protein
MSKPRSGLEQEETMRLGITVRVRLLALMALLVLLAAACGGNTGTDTGDSSEDPSAAPAESDAPEQTEDSAGGSGDGVLVIGTLEKPSTIDPAEVYELMASNLLYNVADTLVQLEPGTGEVAPGVAEEWEVSDDAKNYTFTLREGVKFHDGSDLTSEDVKWSLERALNINHPESAAFLISAIEDIKTPDDTTVEITISEPNVTFLSRLSYTVATILPSDSDAYDAPKKALGKGGEPPSVEEAEKFIQGEQIVGSGPYEMTSYSPDTGATLEAFADYWGDPPKAQTMKLQFFESAAQMTNALRNGEIDVNINDLGPAERAALENEEGLTVEQGAAGRTRYIVLDVTQKPFDDPEVRRAISASIDRQRIVDEVFEGAGEVLTSMIPPSYGASDQEAIANATGEVSDAPVKFDLWYPLNKYGDTEPDVAETIARSLNESGDFDVTTKSSDWAAEYSSNLNNGTYSAYLLGWYPDYIDPDDYIEPFYHSEKTFIGFYGDPEMDKLIGQEQQETDEAARDEIFAEIQAKAAEDMPFIPLYSEVTHAYYGEGICGVEHSIDVALHARWYMIGDGNC